MAPEQAAGDPATDHRADIYAFGVVAYEVLTGRPPFEGRPQELFAAHATESPEPVATRRPAISAALASLVMRCLAKRPADRPQRAEDLVRELDAVPVTSGDQHAVRAGTRWMSLPWTLLFAGVLGLAAVIAYGARSFAHRPPVHHSIAVLPLGNASGDPMDEAFSDGLTDELITALGKLEQLTVTGRASVFALKGKTLSFGAIGDTLRVATLLSGDVRRYGDQFRITLSLDSAANGHMIWANTFNVDRNTKDVLCTRVRLARQHPHAARGLRRLACSRRAATCDSVQREGDRTGPLHRGCPHISRRGHGD
jgi:serine/threonine-protein kinase